MKGGKKLNKQGKQHKQINQKMMKRKKEAIMKRKMVFVAVLLLVSAFLLTGEALADLFDEGIPAGWTTVGNAGTLGANGVVTFPDDHRYGWVSTSGGVTGKYLDYIGGTNGSSLQSSVFSANVGDALDFQFNYVTSDGAGYADYAWARLLDSSFDEVALLFTARTKTSGSIVPGQDMPVPSATLTPPSVPIIPGGPVWSPLGSYSGACYNTGCGYTDWVQSTYTIAGTGNYILEFGVANWSDEIYDSGLAFSGIMIGGVPIEDQNGNGTPVPEPATMLLLGSSLIGLAGLRRKFKK